MGDRDYFHSSFGNAPRRSIFATDPGTKGIIVGLIAIHLLVLIIRSVDFDAYNSLIRALALTPSRVLQGWIWQLLTMAVLHDPLSLLHLGFNCLFIWWFGRMVEQRLSLRQYLGFCAAAAVTGSLAYMLWAVGTGSAAPAYGASGFSMGLTILAACWNPRTEILFFFVIRMQLWVVAVILVLIDTMQALAGSPGVAHAVHLGGALYGWIYFRHGTRIEGVFDGIDRMAETSRRKKQGKDDARNRELRKEIDRILDKVNREGMSALTEEERKFLKSASKKLG